MLSKKYAPWVIPMEHFVVRAEEQLGKAVSIRHCVLLLFHANGDFV
ncbi:hypothetical protein SAMN04487995_0130 [Dyadobacter koreensis]|uniref:Uncharacterized protein n=1 Tax=Dyadobacter koreensis TaxID=408657 RepID=A0A1H6Q0R1_9BACT|nr:hypothetical protein SAMN04487995_0130 [Dyadobacter koreensis]